MLSLNISGNNFVDMPLFMENDEWYYFNADKGIYELKSNVPERVKNSYDAYYKDINAD